MCSAEGVTWMGSRGGGPLWGSPGVGLAAEFPWRYSPEFFPSRVSHERVPLEGVPWKASHERGPWSGAPGQSFLKGALGMVPLEGE